MKHRARRNVARVLAAGLLGVSAVLIATAGSAGADGPGATPTAKGWWWRAAPLPPPPTVQKGQLYVQGNPTDPKGTAFAAVRYTLEQGTTVSSFKLKVGSGGDQGGANAVVQACRTGAAWTAAEGGEWSAAPKVDTTACVNGQRADDGSWTFAVGPLALPGTLDIAIIPGVDPNTKQTSTFSLAFDAPGADALTTSSGATPSPPASGGSTLGGSGATSPAANPASSATHPATPISVPTGLPADKVGATATAPANQVATQPGLDAAVKAATPEKDRDKWPGVVVLVFAALVGLYAWRQDNLMAMNGGRLPGDDAVSGLGRFARPRQGQPPALT
jgi:hypothetical protein